LAGACALAACASQPPSPYFGDEKFLVVGVDPDAEARSLSAQMDKNGYHVLTRARGKTFTALGFGDAHDVPLKARVVTLRGIELALDQEPSTPLSPGVRYELLEAPMRGTQDPDGDGFEEVFVAVHRDQANASCIQIYRVRDSGFVDAIDGKNFTLPDTTPAFARVWDAMPFCELPAEPDAAASPSPSPSPNPSPSPSPSPQ
jgi:hypothetical protein